MPDVPHPDSVSESDLEWLTVPVAADAVGVSIRLVRYWIAEGRLDLVQVDDAGRHLYRLSDVRRAEKETRLVRPSRHGLRQWERALRREIDRQEIFTAHSV